MKIKIKKVFKEVTTKIYIAEDGTKFDNEESCKKYENKQNKKPFRFKLNEMEIKELRDMPPLDINGSEIIKNNYFRWYKVNDVDDVEVFDEIYGNAVVTPKVYPDIVCLEYNSWYGEDFDETFEASVWTYYLSDMKSETMGFWDAFGLKVNFEEVNEND